MGDEVPIAPVVYDGLDPVPEPKAVTAEIGEVLVQAARQSKRAYEAARRPVMPLSVLGSIVREAPLGSLLIAFLPGAAIVGCTRFRRHRVKVFNGAGGRAWRSVGSLPASSSLRRCG